MNKQQEELKRLNKEIRELKKSTTTESVEDVLESIMHRLEQEAKYRGHKGQPNLKITGEINVLQEVMIRLSCKDKEWYEEQGPKPVYGGGGAGMKGSRRTYQYPKKGEYHV